MADDARSTLKLFAVGFGVFAAILLAFAVPPFLHQRRVLKTWTPAEARVVSNQVVDLNSGSGPALYDSEYQFVFVANGRPVIATVRSNRPRASRTQQEAEAQRFPARVAIVYDPANPSEVRVNPGYNAQFFFLPLVIASVGVGFGLIAGGLWLAACVMAART